MIPAWVRLVRFFQGWLHAGVQRASPPCFALFPHTPADGAIAFERSCLAY